MTEQKNSLSELAMSIAQKENERLNDIIKEKENEINLLQEENKKIIDVLACAPRKLPIQEIIPLIKELRKKHKSWNHVHDFKIYVLDVRVGINRKNISIFENPVLRPAWLWWGEREEEGQYGFVFAEKLDLVVHHTDIVQVFQGDNIPNGLDFFFLARDLRDLFEKIETIMRS